MLIVFLLLLAGLLIYFWRGGFPLADVPCTADAKICPDGSAVGRIGPRCEFAACPGATTTAPASWETSRDEALGVSFRYPPDLPTTYIRTVDWPPKLNIADTPYSCLNAGEVGARAGRTEEREIAGQKYCVTEISEGAAGSIYHQYAYSIPANDQTATMTFSLRFVQCGNYEEAQQRVCEEERSSFDLDPLIGQIALTIRPLAD